MDSRLTIIPRVAEQHCSEASPSHASSPVRNRKALPTKLDQKEEIEFTVQSLDAGGLTAQAVLNGKGVDNATLFGSASTGHLSVTAPKGGKVEINVKAKSAPKDAIFVVGATSNLPNQNCTVGLGGSKGLSAGSKAGLGLGIPALICLMGVGSFFAWKHFHASKVPVGQHGTPNYIGDQQLNNTGIG